MTNLMKDYVNYLQALSAYGYLQAMTGCEPDTELDFKLDFVASNINNVHKRIMMTDNLTEDVEAKFHSALEVVLINNLKKELDNMMKLVTVEYKKEDASHE